MTFSSGPIGVNPIVNPAILPTGNLLDMSLLKNIGGQNVTFALINVTNDLPLLGASVTVRVSKDGGAQGAGGGSVSELGQGAYVYRPSQADTNGNCVSFLVTATNAVPENLMFLTSGLHKNTTSQHVTFVMFTTSGIADPSATVSAFVSKDAVAQAPGVGTFTNLGNGQYDYAPTQAETNGTMVSFLFSATGDVIQNLSIFTVP